MAIREPGTSSGLEAGHSRDAGTEGMSTATGAVRAIRRRIALG
jgi:hypothetical protein